MGRGYIDCEEVMLGASSWQILGVNQQLLHSRDGQSESSLDPSFGVGETEAQGREVPKITQ